MKHIKLGSMLFSPAYTLVTVEDSDQEWAVVDVEIYYDPAYTRCLSDGNPITEFDARQQARILNALNNHAEEERMARQILRVEPITARPVDAEKILKLAIERLEMT